MNNYTINTTRTIDAILDQLHNSQKLLNKATVQFDIPTAVTTSKYVLMLSHLTEAVAPEYIYLPNEMKTRATLEKFIADFG